MVIFKDRSIAGQFLAEKLEKYQSSPDVVVIGLPPGGVVVANAMAGKLKLPLNVLVIREITVPYQPEFVLGAVDPDGEVSWDEEILDRLGITWEEELFEGLGVTKDQLRNETEKQLQNIKHKEEIYGHGRSLFNIHNKTVILVDEGITVGVIMTAAVDYLKRHGALRVGVASPVALPQARAEVESIADEAVILHAPEYSGETAEFYQDLPPVSDEEVVSLLRTKI